MKADIVRRKYIEFYKKRDHAEIPSASLVPQDDPTTLFTSSGMQPLISYLLGRVHPKGKRLVNSQKSFRAQDIDEVGDNRHTTFFEMLGNWSLGDYFKTEQLPWIFQFLTEELGLEPKRLYVSVFQGSAAVAKDTESIEIWKEIFSGIGIDANVGERIFLYPADKNWWSRAGEPDAMPTGEPGGPDSEVFFDFGESLELHEKSPWKSKKCHPNCECGRYLEIANSVFMQYVKTKEGTLVALSQKNVDFGGGLERMAAAANGDPDVFTTDLFTDIIKTIEDISEKTYTQQSSRPAMQVIADHLKAATFLIADGVVPANKDRGYVLRRLLRRSAVKMHGLGMSSIPIQGFQEICDRVIRTYEGTYFDENTVVGGIRDVVELELSNFAATIAVGMKKVQSLPSIDGKIAFGLYQSYGFPYEITEELAAQKGIHVRREDFVREYEKHRELSRSASSGMFRGGLADHSEETTKLHTATHLLHQALRTVLGGQVAQSGSNITAERLRFDFSYPVKLSAQELERVEALVNEKISENLPVTSQVLDKEEALRSGALAFFGERYADRVKVYTIGKFSKEICGGPHVAFTGTLGHFTIMKEESAGSGVRRIYAVVSSKDSFGST